MKALILGLLLAALVVHPQLATAAAPILVWAAAQPAVWAFVAGAVARPHLARRLRVLGGAR